MMRKKRAQVELPKSYEDSLNFALIGTAIWCAVTGIPGLINGQLWYSPAIVVWFVLSAIQLRKRFGGRHKTDS